LKIGIGSDHAGFAFKEAIKGELSREGTSILGRNRKAGSKYFTGTVYLRISFF